jgi:hypothetical protein
MRAAVGPSIFASVSKRSVSSFARGERRKRANLYLITIDLRAGLRFNPSLRSRRTSKMRSQPKGTPRAGVVRRPADVSERLSLARGSSRRTLLRLVKQGVATLTYKKARGTIDGRKDADRLRGATLRRPKTDFSLAGRALVNPDMRNRVGQHGRARVVGRVRGRVRRPEAGTVVTAWRIRTERSRTTRAAWRRGAAKGWLVCVRGWFALAKRRACHRPPAEFLLFDSPLRRSREPSA